MKIVVVVPYRPDGGHRDKLWNYLHKHYWQPLDYQIVMGESPDGPFNRSAAINAAANRAWDAAIIADSDTWVPPEQLHLAILNARKSQRLVAAFNAVVELSQPATEKILRGTAGLDDNYATVQVRRRNMETQSSMLVITRKLWDQVGGFDERFVGWGGEDSAFWKTCTLHAGTPQRVTGNAYHLWHRPAEGKFTGHGYMKNLALWRRYESAQTIKDLPC